MDDQKSINITSKVTPADPYDVPDEFKVYGWRKCLSKREKRFYYFNKNTHESVWDLRDLYLLYTKRDPLGISTPSPSVITSPSRLSFKNCLTTVDNSTPKSELSSVVSSRRLSDDYEYPQFKSPSAFSTTSSNGETKRFAKLRLKCNLMSETNAIILERPMSLMLPPHTDIEIVRVEAFNALKDFFVEQLSRYLHKIRVCVLFYDCLIDYTISNKSKRSASEFDDELLVKLDEKVLIEKYLQQNIKRMHDWDDKLTYPNELCESANKFKVFLDGIFLNCAENDGFDKKFNEAYDKDILSWLKWSKATTNAENLSDYYNSLKKKCDKFLIKALQLKLNTFFSEYSKLHTNLSKDLYLNHEKLYEEKKIQIIKKQPKYYAERKVLCYPMLICTPSPFLSTPDLYHDLSTGYSHLTLNEKYSLKTNYFTKLEYLYKLNCKDDKNLDLFLARVWILLKRYEIFSDESIDEKFYTLNTNVYDCFESYFHVTFELFSNPFNCYFKQYCSLFDDTDGYFGSRGAFVNLQAQSGSFLACLPLQLTIVEKYFQQIMTLVIKSHEPLSFIIILPVDDSIKHLVEKTISSEFCKNHINLPKRSVEFNKFCDYKTPKENATKFNSKYDLVCLCIQNREAEFKYPIDDGRLEQLKYELQTCSIVNQLSYSP